MNSTIVGLQISGQQPAAEASHSPRRVVQLDTTVLDMKLVTTLEPLTTQRSLPLPQGMGMLISFYQRDLQNILDIVQSSGIMRMVTDTEKTTTATQMSYFQPQAHRQE